jgi:hypothetical protein
MSPLQCRAVEQLFRQSALPDSRLADEQEQTSATASRVLQGAHKLCHFSYSSNEPGAAVRGGRGRGKVERRSLLQDLLLEITQRLSRLNP